ncbi:MAG: NADH-quinone oxidoreductase subunit D [Epsilonproteobacteria bacterium]|nr:NADH-quinone oxidoreductase subunit D [Campylobacterota bacterium]
MESRLEERFRGSFQKEGDIYIFEKDSIKNAIRYLKDELSYTFFIDLTPIDYLDFVEKKESRFALVYLLRSKNFKDEVILKCYLNEDDLQIETISDIFEGANWTEREAYDQYGIIFKNHPNLKRILNHKEFVGHPLRKDYPITKRHLCIETDDLMDEMGKKLRLRGYDDEEDLTFLNLGPAHPASHGTIRTFVALKDEKIVSAVSEIGYLHRGFEKSCENHKYYQIIPYTDRLNYCSAILNNIAFAHSVEKMLGIEIPDRAKFIRVITGELSRIIDHLVCLAAALVDMGALTNYWYLYNPREDVYDLFSKLTGARLTNSYMRIGGVKNDFYDGFEDDLNHCIKEIQKGVSDSLKLVAHNRIFHDRTQNVGIIDKEDAIQRGVSGPNLRACGVPYDLRAAKPYYYYDTFDFEIPVGSVGDVYDRLMVRFEEITQSISIIKQAMKRLPKGDIAVNDKKIFLPKKDKVYNTIEGLINQFKLIYEGIEVPKGEYYNAIEGANGELGFFIVSDGSGKPYKIKVRPPCFYSMSALPHIIENHLVADAIITLSSLNIIAGELDR